MNLKRVIVGKLEENCYILEKNNNCIIIDPGDEPEKIINNVSLNVVAILITHSHFDHIGALPIIASKYNVPVYKYDNLDEGNMTINEFEFEVIFTPGHTLDSVSFYFAEEQIMFTGDFIFKNSIGRTDLPTGNFKKMQKSIRKITKFNDIIRMYPGHGDSTTLGFEKKYNMYMGGIK